MRPTWLPDATDDNFADLLNYYAHRDDVESLGAGGLLDQLKEGLSRLVHALPNAGSAVFQRVARKKLNARVTRFAGDAFVYLAKRGTQDAPGEIVEIVMSELRRAHAAKTAADNQLDVICHSFGGEIVYDILTHFAPELEVDTLITVGSQVGLFEELKLYLASSGQIPPNPPAGRVPKPTNLKRWLNVFDTNDILSYRVAPIFAGADDYLYETGYCALQAHGGYFDRPSFYTRLAARKSGAQI